MCELIGLYILDKITKGKFPIFPAGNVGLYRDDGLAVIKTRGRAGVLLDDIRKKVHQAFLDEELEITCEKGMTSTDFLDVRLNLETNEYRPYRKPNDHPVYIDARSNHPPNVIKQIPQMIEKRLTNLSSNERVFDEEKAIYVKALKDSGYKSALKYNPEHKKTPKTKRTRNRNPIYYNPPWSENVKTNIGKNFLHLVETHFNKETKYKEAHILSKIFDRSKVKVSYCTMNNMKKHISKHNVKICQKPDNSNVTNVAKCNCRVKDECPLNGECLTTSVVYQASVRCDNSNVEKTYVGLAEGTFKKRWDKHKYTFKHPNASSTALSSYIWKCKKANKNPKIDWSIKAKAHAFSSGGKQCDLCLTEKVNILLANPKSSLNQRNEILEKCRHKRKFLLQLVQPYNHIPPIPP